MLVYDPKARYTAEECLNHPFLQDYKNRPRPKCKETFDFSFDKIELNLDKLRTAIWEEVEAFQERKKGRVGPGEEEMAGTGGKKAKVE